MTASNKNKHLSVEERKIIENAIINNSKKSAIALVLGKDKSTITKEIRLHRILVKKTSLPLAYSNYKRCKLDRNCSLDCSNYHKFTCKRRDRSLGACNGCPDYQYCRFDKYKYNPDIAHSEYRTTLVDAREGVNLTTAEAKEMGLLIKTIMTHTKNKLNIKSKLILLCLN